MKNNKLAKKFIQMEKVLDEFKAENVRVDQYNGKNILMRLAINVEFYSEDQRDEIIDLFKTIDISPEMIIVYTNENKINISWFSQRNNVVSSEEEYLSLVSSFIDYICNLDLNKWNIDMGVFNDDTTEIGSEDYEKIELVINPKFTRESFGLVGKAQIYFN